MAKANGILKNTLTVGGFTALSRVLGLVREMFQSRLIGAGMEQSAFTLAFAVPNMARKVFGEGALAAAFVPVFRGAVESDSMENATRLARAVMTILFLCLCSILLLSLGGIEIVVAFRRELGLLDEARLGLTLRLIKTLLPYMVFICGAAFGMGVLNALGRFKASSFMPSILNIFWIGVLGWLSFCPGLSLGERVQRVAVAILLAGAAQMAFLMVCMARAGVVPKFTFKGWGDAKVRLVWRNLGIALLGGGAVQINYMLDQFLAQKASPWAAGVIGYAERLMDLPLGVIGVAFGTVLLPTFAGLFAKGDLDGAREALASSVRSLMFIMLPAAAGLFALATEITGVIYEGGDFDALATTRVARALAVYSLGLGFFGLMKSLVPWFHAQNDMKTPLRVALWTMVVNATLNILAVVFLPVEWRHVGLAASTVVCAVVGCVSLAILARRRNGPLGLAATVPSIAKIALASVAMGVVVWFLRDPARGFAATIVPGETAGRVAALAVLVAAGGAFYVIFAAIAMPSQLRSLLNRRKRAAK